MAVALRPITLQCVAGGTKEKEAGETVVIGRVFLQPVANGGINEREAVVTVALGRIALQRVSGAAPEKEALGWIAAIHFSAANSDT